MTTKTWNASPSGNWNVPSNWLGGLPGSTDQANITQTLGGAAHTVTVSDAETVQTIMLFAPNTTVQVITGGSLTVGTLFSSDTVTAAGGTLNVQNANSVNGTIAISQSGTVVVPVVEGTITFLDSTGTLEISSLGSFFLSNVISGFQAASDSSTHDTIELLNFSATGLVAHGNTLTVNGAGGPEVLHFNGNYEVGTSGLFNGSAQVIGGNTIIQTNVVACYAEGTRIATPRGETAIEDLAIGDVVKLARGGETRVIWTGKRVVDLAGHPRPDSVRPIRVACNTFGPGQPARDLVMSPDHAIFVDEVLIPIKLLENGETIERLVIDSIVYWHVELQQHDIVLAEGLAAESYLDVDGHATFCDDGVVQPMSRFAPDTLTWRREADACAPLVISGPALNSVRARLNSQMTRHNRRHHELKWPGLEKAGSGRRT